MPKQLSETHQNESMASAIDLLTWYEQEGNAMIERIVTGDEMWVHHYTLPTKKLTMVWKSSDEPTTKKLKALKSAEKVTCTVFWDFKGVIHEEYFKNRQNDHCCPLL